MVILWLGIAALWVLSILVVYFLWRAASRFRAPVTVLQRVAIVLTATALLAAGLWAYWFSMLN